MKMFEDPAAILQAAATLAAAQHSLDVTEARTGSKRYTDSCVDVLLNVLREMERQELIPAGTAPKPKARR